MDHGKGAGKTEPAPVGPAGDAGPMRPGGTKTVLRPYIVAGFVTFGANVVRALVTERML